MDAPVSNATYETPLEALGRKQLELDRLGREYANLLQLLRQVKSGETKVENVVIYDNGWQLNDPPAADTITETPNPAA